MLKLWLVFLLCAPSLFGETLLSGAIYFDSKNTLIEVRELIKSGNTNALSTIIKGNHVSDKVGQDQEVILLVSGSDPDSPVEFRFASDPTTYWTYQKYITVNVTRPVATPAPSLSPGPDSTLPADLPSSLATTMRPTPTPTVTPPPKPPKEETETQPPLVKHKRRVVNNDDDNDTVPESAKVWHLVNGHWKWYDKRLWHEVRRALPVTGPPIAAGPTPTPSPYVPKAPPVRTGP